MLKSMIGSIVSKHFKRKLIGLTINEEDVSEVLKQIRISLLDGDVNLLVVKNFIKSIREKVVGHVLSANEDPEKYILNVIKEELIKILGNKTEEININNSITKIMMVGLQGSGKTTSCAKLANFFKNKKAKKPLLVGIDVYRPAAIEQLRTLANEINVDFYEHGTQDPVKTSDEAITFAKQNGNDLIIFDTAGRLQTNVELMDELKKVRNKVSPDEILLVVDAMTGQDVVNVATEFNNTLDLSGFIITKLDGDARGGAALSLTSLINLPIKFIGTGEKVGSLDIFHPDRMADRILGLGDIMTLAEKAADVIDQDKAKRSITKMLSGKMDLEDLMSQMEQMNKLGSLGSIAKMIPGMEGKISDSQVEEAEAKMRIWKILMSSMTKKERREPNLLKKQASRRLRIVKGSGRKEAELNKLLSEWEKAKEKAEVMGKNIRSGKNPFSSFGF